MTGVTVEQLAKTIKISPDLLLEQLKSFGIEVSGLDAIITDEQKTALLISLKRSHGQEAVTEPKKITLNRKSVSEIKVQRPSGKKGTVSVVSKKRHVYVKREAAAPTPEAEPEIQTEALAQVEATEATKTTKTTKSTKATIDGATQVSASEPVFVSEAELEKEKKAKEAKAKKTAKADVAKSVPSEYEEAKPEPTAEVKTATTTAPSSKVPLREEQKPTSKRGRGRGDDDEESGGRGRKSKRSSGPDRVADWNKAKLLRPGAIPLALVEEEEEEGRGAFGSRRGRSKSKSKEMQLAAVKEIQKRHMFEKPTAPVVRDINIPETITVSELAQKLSAKASDLIKALIKLGTMATINQVLDQSIAAILVEEMGHTPKLVKDTNIEDTIEIESSGELKSRPAVVTVMGHVDHGKTSLLDYIRRTKVAAKEAGGITQHIGAYHVTTPRGIITFLDTPGHAAFTAMRARGVKATDIVVLVVAADDGVMPQTIEAIQHAKAGNVPIVVAINKIDKAGSDLDRINNELSQQGLIPESWGGEVMFIPVSAKEGTGIDTLLEAIALQAEMLDLKAPYDGPAKGIVLEARLDRGRGPVASVLIQQGTLHQGEILLAGSEYGRIRMMLDEIGNNVAEAGPSMPVEIVGLSGTPGAGDFFVVVDDERKAREVAAFRQSKYRDVRIAKQQSQKLEGFFDKMQQGASKTLNIVLKTDVQGSAEALTEALEALSGEEVKVKVISKGVGGINESDVTLSLASEAILIGFNVRADATARQLAEQESVPLNYYSIIYDVVDGVKRAVTGLLSPEFKEKILGLAEVRDVFRSQKLGAVAGCRVIEGVIKRGYPIRILRDNVVIYQGELESLRRFKDDVNEVRQGMECGIGVKNYNDIKVGDQIEVYETVQVARELEKTR